MNKHIQSQSGAIVCMINAIHRHVQADLLIAISLLILTVLPCEPIHADTVTGTAFLVSPDGYAVTCAHVVADATDIQLAISGKSMKAAIIGMDEKNDLALLKVESAGLPVLPIGDVSTAEPAARVWVLGYLLASLLGDSVKVTGGTVSGMSVQGTQRIIQIDAAVNPGNSGAPLLNDRGQAIGIVNAKIVRPDVSGVGFAIPANYLIQLLRDEGVSWKRTASAKELDGPALARNASPAVILVTATIPLKEPVLLRSLKVGPCLSASFSCDWKMVVCAGGTSNKATVWEVNTGKLMQSFPGLSRQDFKPEAELDVVLKSMLERPWVMSAVFSPDGQFVAATSPPLIMLWDVGTGNRNRTMLTGILGGRISFAPNGEWLFHGNGTGWDGNDITCLNIKSGEEFALDTKSCSGICASPCSKFLAVCYGDSTRMPVPHARGTVEVLAVPKGNLVRKITGSRAGISAVCYSPDGRQIAGAETDAGSEMTEDSVTIAAGGVTIWNAETGSVVKTIHCSGMSPGGLQYCPDGSRIAVSLQEAKRYPKARIGCLVGIYDLTSGERIALLPGELVRNAFSEDGKSLAILGEEVVNIWQIK